MLFIVMPLLKSAGHGAENFSILRRLSLNVIRLDPDKKRVLNNIKIKETIKEKVP